jgi:YqaJ-like recombinase protein
MNAADVEQRTDEWRQARCGYVTASRIVDVLRKPRRGQQESVTRKAYLAQVISERLTGKPNEQEFESFDTRRGERLEPLARVEYEMRVEAVVEQVGFIEHPRIKLAGCSPDGMIGSEGLCQIKCPRTHVHLDYLMAGIVPVEYKPQMLFELACTGRKWNDFCSYEPRLPDHLSLFIVRLHRNDAEIADIEQEVVRFLSEVDDILAKLPKSAGKTSLEESLEISLADIQGK